MRLILPLGLVSGILLILTVVVGYGTGFSATDPVENIYRGFAATFGVLLAQSVGIGYLLGIARRLHDVARQRSPGRRALAEHPLPGSPVPSPPPSRRR